MFIADKARGLRRRIYTGFFDLLGDRGLSTFYAPRFAGIGVIFMGHRVMPAGATTLEPCYAITTTALEACLSSITRAGWRLVSLDELHKALVDGAPTERLACFTFDDGYLDNYTLALPIFRKYNAPMCVYAATGMIDRSMFYWWGTLEHLVLTHDTITLTLPGDPGGTRRMATGTLAAKLAAYQSIDAWAHANPELVEDVLRPLFRDHGVDERVRLDRDVLTPAQLREMAADPLVTIGSHAMTHSRLSLMTEEAMRTELVASRQCLEEWSGTPVRHLAYPFGGRNSCGPREFEAAKDSGYLTAVTTRRGNIFPDHRDHLLSLPRRETSPVAADARLALYGLSTILRRDPLMVTD